MEGHDDGSFIKKKWRLEDIFKSQAMWTEILECNNEYGSKDSECEVDQTHGYTKSFEGSAAKSKTVTKSLKISAGGAFKGLDLGAERTKTVTNDYSSSVDLAMSESYTTTTKVKMPIKK